MSVKSMLTWSDEHLKIILLAANEADGGCPHCVSLVLTEFFNQTGFDLIERMEKIFEKTDLGRRHKWDDVAPKWYKYEEKKPQDSRYWCE